MELFKFLFIDNFIITTYVLNLFILATLIFVLVRTRSAGRNLVKVDDYIGTVRKTIDSVRFGDLSKKIEQTDIPQYEELAESLNRMLDTLADRERMVEEYQNELSRQNKLLEAVINTLSDGLIVTDENNKILRATQPINNWFDIDGKKLTNDNILNYIELPDNKNILNLNNNEINIKNNNSSCFVASTVELKLDDKKKRYVTIIKDITNQKELENLKEDFVATLTHDLKVPIIAETNMLELFLNGSFGKISDKQVIALKNMQSSNKELLELVQTVLDTYKFKDHTIRLYKDNIMLKGFINEIISDMTPIANKSKNTFKFNLQRDIRVLADRLQLKRVVKNLIQNAISYGEADSPIEITIGEIPKFIIIKIKDYGAGISKENIHKIFNKYYSSAKKFRKIGTGLGLYLAYQIIKAHNGDLTVESIEGEYTEFCIKLPATNDSIIYYGE